MDQFKSKSNYRCKQNWRLVSCPMPNQTCLIVVTKYILPANKQSQWLQYKIASWNNFALLFWMPCWNWNNERTLIFSFQLTAVTHSFDYLMGDNTHFQSLLHIWVTWFRTPEKRYIDAKKNSTIKKTTATVGIFWTFFKA